MPYSNGRQYGFGNCHVPGCWGIGGKSKDTCAVHLADPDAPPQPMKGKRVPWCTCENPDWEELPAFQTKYCRTCLLGPRQSQPDTEPPVFLCWWKEKQS